MDVSIIIVNYNTSRLINDCLGSIVDKTSDLEYEVIIVDNNTENLNEAIINPGIQNLRYIQLDENVGFGRANNEGVKIASGRNIFFLNPDTILLNNAVKELSSYLDAHPECGACGGNLYDENMCPTRSHRRVYPSNIGLVANTVSGGLYDRIISGRNPRFNNDAEPIEVAYIVGADLMIPRRIIEKAGAFDPDFFMYYEEIELCFRIHRLGYKIINLPSAHIQHLEGKSGNGAERKARQHYISSSLFFRKRYGSLGYKINRAILPFVVNTRLFIARLLGRGSMETFWNIWSKEMQNK